MQSKKFLILEEELQRRKIKSSHIVAERITQFFIDFVKQDGWGELPANLLATVKAIGKRLSEADHLNFVVPNTVKRVLHIIREACKELRLEAELPHEEGKQEFERKKGGGKQAADDFALFELNLTKLGEKGQKQMMNRKTMTLSSTNLSRSMTTMATSSIGTDKEKSEKAKKKE